MGRAPQIVEICRGDGGCVLGWMPRPGGELLFLILTRLLDLRGRQARQGVGRAGLKGHMAWPVDAC